MIEIILKTLPPKELATLYGMILSDLMYVYTDSDEEDEVLIDTYNVLTAIAHELRDTHGLAINDINFIEI